MRGRKTLFSPHALKRAQRGRPGTEARLRYGAGITGVSRTSLGTQYAYTDAAVQAAEPYWRSRAFSFLSWPGSTNVLPQSTNGSVYTDDIFACAAQSNCMPSVSYAQKCV